MPFCLKAPPRKPLCNVMQSPPYRPQARDPPSEHERPGTRQLMASTASRKTPPHLWRWKLQRRGEFPSSYQATSAVRAQLLHSASHDLHGRGEHVVAVSRIGFSSKIACTFIHAWSLRPDLLAWYQQQYPDNVITSICAMPVYEQSCFRVERKVLLRGPFFQMVHMTTKMGGSTACIPASCRCGFPSRSWDGSWVKRGGRKLRGGRFSQRQL